MELEVCWSVEVIKGGFTGILRLVLSLSVISISLLSNFSDICFASSIFESFRSDFFTFNLKDMDGNEILYGKKDFKNPSLVIKSARLLNNEWTT